MPDKNTNVTFWDPMGMGSPLFSRRSSVSEIRQVDGEERSLVAYASTKAVDSYNEVILPDAFDLKRFQKNPVVPWAHNYREPPVAKALWTKPDKIGLLFKPQFATTNFADDIFRLYEGGYLNAFSVGFDPQDWVGQDEEDYGALLEQWEIEGYPKTIYKKVDLYEISAVPLPANEDALVNALNGGLVRSPQMRDWIEREQQRPNILVCGVTPFANLPTAPVEQRWNPNGQPDSDLIGAILGPNGDNWDRAKKAHFWWDGEGGKQSAYKLKFARMYDPKDPNNVAPKNGTLTAIWRQVASRMGILLGARGGVDIPDSDRRPVYNHIVRYYKKFDKEPPDFKSLAQLMADLQTQVEAMAQEIKGIRQAQIENILRGMEQKLIRVASQPHKPEFLPGVSLEEVQRRVLEITQGEIRRLQGHVD